MEEAILDELCRAAERLGADGERIRALPRAEIYDALEDLEADRFLLGIVGSWGDTLNDDQVLVALQRWNRGEPPFDYSVENMLSRREPYRDLGPAHFDQRNRTRTTSRLLKRLKEMGIDVLQTRLSEPAALSVTL
jgi:hypothetical protein